MNLLLKSKPDPMKQIPSLEPERSRKKPAGMAGFALGCLVSLFAVPAVFAATDTWTGATDANLATAGNWQAGTMPASGDTLLFSSADPSGTLLTNNLTTAFTLIFSNTAPAYTITGNSFTTGGGIISSNKSTTSLQTIAYNFVLGGSGNTIGDAGGGTLISGVISGGHGLSKSGAGTVSLSGVNTFNNTGSTIYGGALNIIGAGLFTGSSLAINSGGSFNYNSSATNTFLGVITGVGAVNVNGPGTLNLPGANTYSGPTTINGGRLVILSSSTGTGAMTDNDGGTLDVTASGTSQLKPASLTVGTSLGATNEFLSVNSTTTAPLKPGTLTLNGVNTINILSGGLTAGASYPLVNYTTLAGTGSYQLGTLPTGIAGTLSTANNTFYLNITATTPTTNSLIASDAIGASSFNSGANWAGGAAPVAGSTYLTGAFLLRTPASSSPFIFAGVSLEIQSGGDLRDKDGGVITVPNLLLDNSATLEESSPTFASGTTATWAGAITLTGGTATIHAGIGSDAAGSTFNITAPITGPGGFQTTGQNGIILLTASNSFSGGVTLNGLANSTLQLGNSNAVVNSSITNALPNGLTFSPGISSFNVATLTDAGLAVPEALTNTAGGPVTVIMGGVGGSSAYSGILSGAGGLTVAGAGTLTLSGANTYSGATTVGAGGSLVISGSGQLGAGTSYPGEILDYGAVTNDSSAAQSFTGGLSGTGALVQNGSGTLGLAAIGSIGTLTASDGTTLDVIAAGASQLSATTVTLGDSAGATNEFLQVSSTTTAPLNATSLTLNGVTTINILDSSLAVGVYPLISFGSITGAGSIVLGVLPTSDGGTLITNGDTIALNITSSAPTIWTGAVSPEWDINTTANWTFNGAGSVYVDGAAVQFGDAGVTQFSIDLAANVAPGGMTFVNSANNYTIGSAGGYSIGGGNGLTLTGSGSVTLNTVNTFTGSTLVSAGQLIIGGNGDLGAGTYSAAITLANNGSLNYNSSVAQTLSGAISGNGSLIQNGPGTLTLSGTDTYTGGTTVSNADLAITTANTTSAVTVNDGGILDLTVSGASQLTPASLTLGSSSGATAEFLNVSSTATAPVNVTTLTLNGTTTINILSGALQVGVSYPLIQYVTLSGGGAYVLGSVPSSGYISSLSTSNNTIYLNITPETFTLDASDPVGTGTPSFTTAGNWNPSAAPQPGDLYLTANFQLRTPASASSLTFAGASLEIQAGGGLRDKDGGVITVTNLILDAGGTLEESSPTFAAGSTTATWAGAITLSGGTGIIHAGITSDTAGSTFDITAAIGGPGGFQTTGQNGIILLTASNSFTGGVTLNGLVNSTLQLGNSNAVVNSSITNTLPNGLTFSPGLGSFNVGGLTDAGLAIPEALTDTSGGPVTLVLGGNNSSTVYSGILSGSGGLVKSGAGTLTLSGANTFTGGAVINAGTLDVSAGGAGAVVVNDGAVLDITVSGTNQFSPTSLTLGTSAGATNQFLLVGSTNVAPESVGVLVLNGANTLNILSGNFVSQTSYPLLSYASLSGTGSFTLGRLPVGVSGNLSTVGKTIYLNVTAVSATIWTGAINANWDIGGTANWTLFGAGSVYLDGSTVVFDDGAAHPNVNIVSNVSPASVTVSNRVTSYSFNGGAVGGNGGLTKLGAGLLTLNNGSTYSGATVISNGTVQLGINNALPMAGNVNLAGGVLDLNSYSQTLNGLSGGGTVDTVAGGTPVLTVGLNNASSTFSGVIQNSAGSLALTLDGNGTLTLNNTCTYTGPTTSEGGGTLIISGNNTNGQTPFFLGNASTLRFSTNYITSQGLTVSPVTTDTETIEVDTNVVATLEGGLLGGSTGAEYIWLTGGGTLDLSNAVCTFNARLRLDVVTLIIDTNTVFTDDNNDVGLQIGSGVVPGAPANSTGTLTVQGNGQLILTSQGLRCGSDANGSTGILNVLGNGSVNVPLLYLPRQTGNTGVVNQTGGLVTTPTINGGNSGAGAWQGTYNLNGGTLAWGGGFNGGPAGGLGVIYFNFNGGTLQFTAGTAEGGWTSVNVMGGGATIDTMGNSVSYADPLAAGDGLGGGLTVMDSVGGGLLTLNGANTYTGNTTVNGGTLELALPTLAANSTVTVTNGAVLQLDFAVTNTVAALVLNGIVQAPGVYNGTTSPSYLTGPGSLLVTGVVPVITRFSLSGSSLVISGTNGLAGEQYNVLTTTNLALPLSNWTVLPTNTFTAGGFNLTNTVNATAPRSFYILRVP
jgi:autotransporter-associated beta strand protein